jgi:hypothetical protein
MRRHAIVQAEEDSAIWKADETVEVADPWINNCEYYDELWSSEVMWLVDGTSDEWLEIGWRRECTVLDGPFTYMYYARGNLDNNGNPHGFPSRFYYRSTSAPVVVYPGERVEVSIERLGPSTEEGYDRWQFKVGRADAVPGKVTMPDTFAPTLIQVGGEVLSDMHDLGVAGHLETRYRLSNGTQKFLYDQTLADSQYYPRYRIVAGTGGFGGSRYFQNHSNIHVGSPSPTALPYGAEMCEDY